MRASPRTGFVRSKGRSAAGAQTRRQSLLGSIERSCASPDPQSKPSPSQRLETSGRRCASKIGRAPCSILSAAR